MKKNKVDIYIEVNKLKDKLINEMNKLDKERKGLGKKILIDINVELMEHNVDLLKENTKLKNENKELKEYFRNDEIKKFLEQLEYKLKIKNKKKFFEN